MAGGEKLWQVRFSVTRTLSAFPRLSGVSSDRVTRPDYYFEGRLRSESTHALFQYTLAGEGVFFDARGRHRVPAGHGFLCRISDPQTGYFYPATGRAPWIHMFMGIRGADAMVDELVRRFGGVYRVELDSPLILRLRDYERYDGTLVELSPGEAALLVNTLLATLADVGVQETYDTRNARLVREARRFVRAHLEQSLNVTELADAVGVSHEHLSRVFKKETGLSPLAYLSQEKVRRACEWLHGTSMSCKEICHRLGYDNASHFARTFRRVTGMTPMHFRRHSAIPF
ncbi:MAG: helix-turn-helix domain-containing protein [Kiritimatiellae bacterium]|nr:helix-turn-helix domain-containing protein [Kiritimatiellia bacterium]